MQPDWTPSEAARRAVPRLAIVGISTLTAAVACSSSHPAGSASAMAVTFIPCVLASGCWVAVSPLGTSRNWRLQAFYAFAAFPLGIALALSLILAPLAVVTSLTGWLNHDPRFLASSLGAVAGLALGWAGATWSVRIAADVVAARADGDEGGTTPGHAQEL